MHIPFVPQKDIVTAGKQVLGHVREFLPIMARAAHSSLSDLPTHNITVTDDDFEGEALLGIAVGEDFQILVNFGPAPRNSCLPADSIPAAVGVQKVVCTYFSLSGGSYWEPPDMVEYDFFEGTNLGEALEAIVLFERREAIRGALESYLEDKALAEMAEASRDFRNAARFHAPGSKDDPPLICRSIPKTTISRSSAPNVRHALSLRTCPKRTWWRCSAMYVWGVGTYSFWKLNRTGDLLLGSGATALGGLAMAQSVQQSRCVSRVSVIEQGRGHGY